MAKKPDITLPKITDYSKSKEKRKELIRTQEKGILEIFRKVKKIDEYNKHFFHKTNRGLIAKYREWLADEHERHLLEAEEKSIEITSRLQELYSLLRTLEENATGLDRQARELGIFFGEVPNEDFDDFDDIDDTDDTDNHDRNFDSDGDDDYDDDYDQPTEKEAYDTGTYGSNNNSEADDYGTNIYRFNKKE